MVASEDSSGKRLRRGGITKTGNAHLRRVLIEAAWSYRHRPSVGAILRKRHAGLKEEVKTSPGKRNTDFIVAIFASSLAANLCNRC
jgi:transposase